jgi:hypothetical protein
MGQPVRGAELWIGPKMWGTEFPAPIELSQKKPVFVTQEDGRFRLECKTGQSMGYTAFVYAPGFNVVLLSSATIGDRPIHIRLVREDSATVLVKDKQGRPIANANVTAYRSSFDNAFWIANLTPEFAERVMVNTNSRGEATVKGFARQSIETILVEREERGKQTYVVPRADSNETVESRITIDWLDATSCSLTLRASKANGEPLPGCMVVANVVSEEFNPNVMTRSKLGYTQFGTTDEQGMCVLSNISIDQIELLVRPPDAMGCETQSRIVDVKSHSTKPVEFTFSPTYRTVFSIIDETGNASCQGINVFFRKRVGTNSRRPAMANASADEDGLGEVELEEGTWQCEIGSVRSLPSDTYAPKSDPPLVFEVKATNKNNAALPLTIRRGKRLEGTITGLDMKEVWSDFLFATCRMDGKEQEFEGVCFNDGTFRIVLPETVDPASLDQFRISYAPVTNVRTLKVVSRSPLQLRWEPTTENRQE